MGIPVFHVEKENRKQNHSGEMRHATFFVRSSAGALLSGAAISLARSMDHESSHHRAGGPQGLSLYQHPGIWSRLFLWICTLTYSCPSVELSTSGFRLVLHKILVGKDLYLCTWSMGGCGSSLGRRNSIIYHPCLGQRWSWSHPKFCDSPFVNLWGHAKICYSYWPYVQLEYESVHQKLLQVALLHHLYQWIYGYLYRVQKS